jgi:hypothetical protein
MNRYDKAREVKHKCNCPHGELLAALGETTNG